MGPDGASLVEVAIAVAVGITACAAGGAACGIIRGGKTLGNEFAAVMGFLYGLTGAGGVIVGIILVALLR